MDIAILIFSFVTLLVYLLLQIAVFRFIRPDRALVWLIKLYCLTEGIAIIAGYSIVRDPSYMVLVSWQCVIFTLIAAVYIFSVFSFTEASITMRILVEIATRDGRGITKKDIWKRYNTRVIVDKRVSRFLAGGDIEKKGSHYVWKNSFSPFILRQYIVSIVQFFFPHTR